MRLTFDRGTLLLEGPRGPWVKRVPALLWDSRVGAFRATAHRHAEVRRGLEAAGLRVDDRVGRRPPSLLVVRGPELRPYQQQALLAWEMAGRRGVVVLPTGSGKTIVALAAMARLRCATLVLVPTRALLEQWVATLTRSHFGPIGVLGDGSRTVHDLTVATFESAYRTMDSFGDRFGLLVVDEAHHFGGGVRAEALEMCIAPARLGLTATPPEAGGTIRLAALVGPVVFELTVRELSGQHLAPYDHVRMFVELTAEERRTYEEERLFFEEAYGAFRRSGGSSEWPEFVRVAQLTPAGRRALRGFQGARRVVASARAKLEAVARLLARHARDRCIVFTADNTAAYAISADLLIPAITCDIGREERRAVLERIRRGELRALVSARVLNEGIDVPELRVGVIIGGTLGGREHVQRVGRLLRPGPGKRALLYEVVARNTFEVSHSQRRKLALFPRTAA